MEFTPLFAQHGEQADNGDKKGIEAGESINEDLENIFGGAGLGIKDVLAWLTGTGAGLVEGAGKGVEESIKGALNGVKTGLDNDNLLEAGAKLFTGAGSGLLGGASTGALDGFKETFNNVMDG